MLLRSTSRRSLSTLKLVCGVPEAASSSVVMLSVPRLQPPTRPWRRAPATTGIARAPVNPMRRVYSSVGASSLLAPTPVMPGPVGPKLEEAVPLEEELAFSLETRG